MIMDLFCRERQEELVSIKNGFVDLSIHGVPLLRVVAFVDMNINPILQPMFWRHSFENQEFLCKQQPMAAGTIRNQRRFSNCARTYYLLPSSGCVDRYIDPYRLISSIVLAKSIKQGHLFAGFCSTNHPLP
mmetsp:Transcript_17154/g.39726  ORF Transcript_17154/g.39726 Transcript_17154/m.39726 type:complete len:131 (-) Transcript_17154:197-589(-)